MNVAGEHLSKPGDTMTTEWGSHVSLRCLLNLYNF